MQRPAATERASGPTLAAAGDVDLDRASQAVALYAAGRTLHEVAGVLGVSHTTVSRWLEERGIQRRAVPLPKKQPRPDTRERCENAAKRYLEDDSLSLKAAAAEAGISGPTLQRYLEAQGIPRRSPGEHGRVHPVPTERTCECGCGQRFTPTGAQVARGGGRFRSTSCANRVTGRLKSEQREQRGHGRYIACANAACPKERWVWASAEARRGSGLFFCSRRCWGLYRWRRAIGVKRTIESLVERGFASKADRHKWKRRWNGLLGGAPRKTWTHLQARAVLELRSEGLGIIKTAQRTGLSEWTVRQIRKASPET
jgi:AraC-like DNA-binding protein